MDTPNIVGTLMDLFYRDHYEAATRRIEELEHRLRIQEVAKDTLRERNRVIREELRALNEYTHECEHKIDSMMEVFDTIYRSEPEEIREPVELIVRQTHEYSGGLQDLIDLIDEHQTDDEFDVFMETIITEADV